MTRLRRVRGGGKAPFRSTVGAREDSRAAEAADRGGGAADSAAPGCSFRSGARATHSHLVWPAMARGLLYREACAESSFSLSWPSPSAAEQRSPISTAAITDAATTAAISTAAITDVATTAAAS